MKKFVYVILAGALLFSCKAPVPGDLPREAASEELLTAFQALQDSVVNSFSDPKDYMRMINLHSLMVVKDGKVVLEKWFQDNTPEKPHVMYSVSKTFTSIAVGLAISEGKMKLKDRVADYFPDKVVADNPCKATVEDLLMMGGGHETDPTLKVLTFDRHTMKTSVVEGSDLAEVFFSHPFVREPGTLFCYNSLGTYLLSAIITKVTGQSVLDYLTPKLFEPLGIEKPVWDGDENGVNYGGWGLSLKTEDMAKVGLLLLQKGSWQGKRLIPASWVEKMGAKHIDCAPAQMTPEAADALLPPEKNDWRQGYGFQTWLNKVEGFRADGAGGQFILVLPKKNAVVVATAWLSDAQREMDLIWDTLYPAL